MPYDQYPTIYLIRHGNTDLNAGVERIRGWADVPLNDEGIKNASHMAQALVNAPPEGVQPSTFFSSDLGRAVDTARIANSRLPKQVPIHQTSGLRPWNVGWMTGKPVEEIKQEMIRLVRNPEEPVINGESYREFQKRFMSTFDYIANLALRSHDPLAVVTHSRGTRLVKSALTEGVDKAWNPDVSEVLARREDPIEPDGFAVLQFDGRRWVWLLDVESHSDKDTE